MKEKNFIEILKQEIWSLQKPSIFDVAIAVKIAAGIVHMDIIRMPYEMNRSDTVHL